MKRCLLFQVEGSQYISYLGRVDDLDYKLPQNTHGGYFYFGYILNFDVYDVTLYEITCDNYPSGTVFIHTGLSSREFKIK